MIKTDISQKTPNYHIIHSFLLQTIFSLMQEQTSLVKIQQVMAKTLNTRMALTPSIQIKHIFFEAETFIGVKSYRILILYQNGHHPM